MNNKKNKAISASLMAVMTATSAVGAAHSVNEVQAANVVANKDVHAVHAKVEQITYSLKKNYLGLKNIGQWEKYIKEARKLNEKLPNGSSKDKFAARINRAEALVNAAARVNKVEKSMASNAHTMKNVPQWEEYIELAKKDLAKVDLGVFKNRYNELLERTAERFKGIEKVKTSYKESYNKVEELIKEAEKLEKTDKDKALEKYKEAKKEAEKLQSHSSKDEILNNIDKVIKNNSGSQVKPEEKPENKPSTGGGHSSHSGSHSSSIVTNLSVNEIEQTVKFYAGKDAEVTIDEDKYNKENDLAKDKAYTEAKGEYTVGIGSLEAGKHELKVKVGSETKTIPLNLNKKVEITKSEDLAKLNGKYDTVTINAGKEANIGEIVVNKLVVNKASELILSGSEIKTLELNDDTKVTTATNIKAGKAFASGSEENKELNKEAEEAKAKTAKVDFVDIKSQVTIVSTEANVFKDILINTTKPVIIDASVNSITINKSTENLDVKGNVDTINVTTKSTITVGEGIVVKSLISTAKDVILDNKGRVETAYATEEDPIVVKNNKPIEVKISINIPDAKLKKVINYSLSPDRKEDAPVTKSEIESIKKLRSDGVLPFLSQDKWVSEAPSRGIGSLEGLQYAVNLEEVDLSENAIKDLTPLKDLKKLTYLELDRNMLGDLTPLKDIKTLEHLNIYNNDAIVDTTPLKDLTNLKWIDLHYCNRGKETVKVDPLGSLVNLEYLDFESNFISDISFVENLNNLKILGVGANNITDLTKIPQDLLREACVEGKSNLSESDPEYRYVGMYGQKLKEPVNIKLSEEKAEYRVVNPVKGIDMILENLGVEQPGIAFSGGEIAGAELSYDKGKKEIIITIDPKVIDLKEHSAPSIHVDYENYLLVIDLKITK